MRIYLKITAILLLFAIIPIPLPIHALDASLSPGAISANAACLIEAESGRVLWGKRESRRLPMASTTKIMTAIIALESGIGMDTRIKVPPEAVGIEGSSVYLRAGETVTLEMLLYALLLCSANDAAAAIAIAVCGSVEKFVEKMNEKADALGLSDTHFCDPHGLSSEGHYTTAHDLARLLAYAMRNESFSAISGTKLKAFEREGSGTRQMTNHNRLLRTYEGTLGGKTGFTKKSGRCLATCAERDGLRLICVTLNAPSDWSDHAKLYDFGFENYKRVTIATRQLSVPVISGTCDTVNVSSEGVSLFLAQDSQITVKIDAPHFLYAPLKAGQKVGKILFYRDGVLIHTEPLSVREDVDAQRYKFNLLEWIINLFKDIKWKK